MDDELEKGIGARRSQTTFAGGKLGEGATNQSSTKPIDLHHHNVWGSAEGAINQSSTTASCWSSHEQVGLCGEQFTKKSSTGLKMRGVMTVSTIRGSKLD